MTAAYWDDPDYLYGDAGRTYDQAPSDFDANRLEWRFEAAWLGGSQYYSEDDGRTEAIRATDCEWTRGRPKYINYDGKGLEMYSPGRMVITLTNYDHRYDPRNEDSPLYPYVKPGALCRLGVRRAGSGNYGRDDSYTWRFSGIVEDINIHTDTGDREKWVEITVVDGWQYLMEKHIYQPALEGDNIAMFYARLLAGVGWPAEWGHDLELIDSDDDMPYSWAGGEDVRFIIHKAAEIFAGWVWIDGRGELNYRTWAYAPALKADLDEADLLRNIQIQKFLSYQFNYVTLAVRKYLRLHDLAYWFSLWGDSVRFWEYGADYRWEGWRINEDEISIPMDETIEISGEYAIDEYEFPNNPFVVDEPDSLVGCKLGLGIYGAEEGDPVMFLCEFGSETAGAGDDVSTYVSVDFQDGGTGFSVRMTNNYTDTVYSRLLVVAGQYRLWQRTPEIRSVSKDATDGAPRKTFTVDSQYLIKHPDFMSNEDVSALLERYAYLVTLDHELPTFMLEGQPTFQFMDIMDRVKLTLPTTGIEESFYIGQIKETWLTANGQAVRTTIVPEPYFEEE